MKSRSLSVSLAVLLVVALAIAVPVSALAASLDAGPVSWLSQWAPFLILAVGAVLLVSIYVAIASRHAHLVLEHEHGRKRTTSRVSIYFTAITTWLGSFRQRLDHRVRTTAPMQRLGLGIGT